MTEPIDVSEHRIIIVNHNNEGRIPIDIEGIVLEVLFTSAISIKQHSKARKLIDAGQIEELITNPCLSRKLKIKVRWENDTRSLFTPTDILIRSNVVLCNNIWGNDDEDDYLKYAIDNRKYHELKPNTNRINHHRIGNLLDGAVLSTSKEDIIFGSYDTVCLQEIGETTGEEDEILDEVEEVGGPRRLTVEEMRQLAKESIKTFHSKGSERTKRPRDSRIMSWSTSGTSYSDYSSGLATYYTTYTTNTTN